MLVKLSYLNNTRLRSYKPRTRDSTPCRKSKMETNGRTDAMDGLWADVRTNGRTDVHTDGRTNVWTDRRMDRQSGM